jgi:hypothetical protein
MANPVNPNQNPLMMSQFPVSSGFVAGGVLTGYDTRYPGVNFGWTYDTLFEAFSGGVSDPQIAQFIEDSGQTFDEENLEQISIGVATNVTVAAQFYDASGTPNTIICAQSGESSYPNIQLPYDLVDLMSVTFKAANTSTGACMITVPTQITVNNLDLVSPTGAPLTAGAIVANNYYTVSYSQVSNNWILQNAHQEAVPYVKTVTGNIVNNTDPQNPVVTQIQPDWNAVSGLGKILNQPNLALYVLLSNLASQISPTDGSSLVGVNIPSVFTGTLKAALTALFSGEPPMSPQYLFAAGTFTASTLDYIVTNVPGTLTTDFVTCQAATITTNPGVIPISTQAVLNAINVQVTTAVIGQLYYYQVWRPR